eukprot:1649217-Rhodomonas_salina.1
MAAASAKIAGAILEAAAASAQQGNTLLAEGSLEAKLAECRMQLKEEHCASPDLGLVCPPPNTKHLGCTALCSPSSQGVSALLLALRFSPVGYHLSTSPVAFSQVSIEASSPSPRPSPSCQSRVSVFLLAERCCFSLESLRSSSYILWLGLRVALLLRSRPL